MNQHEHVICFIMYYLTENTEYPELLANGGKILQMYIKTYELTVINSCCFLSMPLSKFSDTFNLPDVVKGTFPHCFNTPNNYGNVGLLPALHHYEPEGLKNPLDLNSSSCTVSTQMTSLFLAVRFTNTVRLMWHC